MTKDQETQQYVLTLVHNPKMHGDDIQVIADDCVEIQKVIESFMRKEPAPKAKSKGRRPSMADSVRRSSVSMNTNSILEDMADAFGDWDFDEGAAPIVATNGNALSHVFNDPGAYTILVGDPTA